MEKFYVTMGQVHVHSIDEKTIDKDCVVEIEAVDYEQGRKKAFELFDNKFCFIKQEKPDMSFFSRGIIKLK